MFCLDCSCLILALEIFLKFLEFSGIFRDFIDLSRYFWIYLRTGKYFEKNNFSYLTGPSPEARPSSPQPARQARQAHRGPVGWSMCCCAARRRPFLGVHAVHATPCSPRPRPYLRRRLVLRAIAQAPLAFVLPRPVSAASARTKPRRQPPREPTQGSASGRRRDHLELRNAESHTRRVLWSPVDHWNVACTRT
jgi:hypothetical protein